MNSPLETRNSKLPSHARAVVIGGGIAGCSTAYHLAKLGWKDVVLLERRNISGGTTWHAAGLVTQLRNSRTLIDIARYSIALYDRITEETGVETGFNRTGSISVARTQGRMDEFRKIASLGRSYGIEIEPISPGEAGEMWPMMRIDDLVGGLYIPRDAQMVPHLAAAALARGAEMAGAQLFENVSVTGILQDRGAVTGVSTDQGDIACDYVVIAAGMWSRDLGLDAGVKVPLMAAEHMYLVTRPMGLPHDAKSLRDPDEQIYVRRDQEEKGAILMGGFESAAKPWPDGPHDSYNFSLVEPDWEHFKVFWENAIYRVPQMDEAGIDRFYVSAESFTPDNRYILGEAPELRNLYLCTGLNSTGIAAGPGSGHAVAEWMVEGHPTMDLWEVDPRRFHQYQNGRKYLYDRTVESVGTLYGMHWPHKQMETARMARRSPLHDRLAARGACFGEAGGWERPNWFAPEGVEARYEYSYGRQNWFDYSAAEHRAVREAVGLFDQTSFAKFMLQGSDAATVLQQLCANDVDVPVGRVVYTAMLNERGGIEADLTVTRIAQDSYLIVTGGAVSARDYGWIESHIPTGSDASLVDVTSAYSVLGLMGPRSRDLLSDVTDSDVSNDAMPFLSSHGARDADNLRGRAGLGAVHAHRVRRRGLRRDHGPRRGARAEACRVPRHGVPPGREGLPCMGPRHRRPRHSPRGRAGLCRRDGQAQRVHRQGCPARAAVPGADQAARRLRSRRPGAPASRRRAHLPRRQAGRSHDLRGVRTHGGKLGWDGVRRERGTSHAAVRALRELRDRGPRPAIHGQGPAGGPLRPQGAARTGLASHTSSYHWLSRLSGCRSSSRRQRCPV